MIRKSFTVLPGTTKVLDVDNGIVEAWVNSTAVEDAQRDIMEPGCWADVCKAASAGEVEHPSTVWGHDWSITTGKVLSAQEFPPGDAAIPEKLRLTGAGALKITAQYNLETQRGREAYSDVKFGAIRQWSVGFLPDENAIRYDSKGVRHIGRVSDWPEVSNVLMGASPGTMTASVKQLPPEGRKERTADRLARACAMVDAFKVAPVDVRVRMLSGTDVKAKFEMDDGKYPIDNCSDVEDAWKLRNHSTSHTQEQVERHVRHAARELGCDGPWNDGGGKEAGEGEDKASECEECKAGGGVAGDPPGVPYLEGDEAVHNGPLMQVLDGLNTLIAQEIAEGGYTEYGDIIRLCCLAQDAILWAACELSEYGDMDSFSVWDLMAAGRAALNSKNESETELEPPAEEAAEKAAPVMATWLRAAILADTEADPASPQPPNPANSGDGDGFERRFVEGFSGYRGLHQWLQQGAVGPPLDPKEPQGDSDPEGPPSEWTQRLTSPWHQQT